MEFSKKRLVALEYFDYERVWPWVGFYEANHQWKQWMIG